LHNKNADFAERLASQIVMDKRRPRRKFLGRGRSEIIAFSCRESRLSKLSNLDQSVRSCSIGRLRAHIIPHPVMKRLRREGLTVVHLSSVAIADIRRDFTTYSEFDFQRVR